MKEVRLTPYEQRVICDAFVKNFGNKSKLWIFGSRADLNQKGGDIDLYIEPKTYDPSTILNQDNAFVVELWQKLGEQKIDVVIQDPSQNLKIYTIAKESGAQLV